VHPKSNPDGLVVHASKGLVPSKPEVWLFTVVLALPVKEEEEEGKGKPVHEGPGDGNGERKGGDETGVPKL
jgi:hypothetical protein